ncbi:hypothetical protein Bca4012_072751 [Brassica carinata]|uniref:Uncharacterized protein n=1 Tax=Brassica carinata TaxID=52824 RepID=A0A8X7U9A6_BRACI|nr:hypothetical protein Bca52824_065112 [Brassica carinata]
MVLSDSPSGDKSTSAEAAPTAAAFVDTIMERMAQQDAVQKPINKQPATILAPLTGNSKDPASTIRRQLFDTYRTASAVQTPGSPDLTTVQELTELKQSLQDIRSKIHEGTSSAPLIERVLAETLRTPFTQRITDVQFRPTEKI